MRGSKRKDDDFNDSESEFGDERTDGNNARVFSSIVGAGGYIPHHKEPPRYIRIKAYNKKNKEFNRMFLAQELVGTKPSTKDTDEKVPLVTVSTGAAGRLKTETGGAIWTTEFSKDGKYLATAGRDEVVRIWAVISTHEDRRAHEDEESANGGVGERLSAPVFMETPIHEFEGHTGEILDLSWSKNNFLLSTSMDKTVRLWHVSRKECLCTFKHKEFVSKVAFHPTDDRFFLAGCLDATLRLWSIPDKNVAYSVQLPDLITAVAFSPDGKTAIAGLLNGLCHFYDTDGLKAQSHLHVRSSRGKNAKGSKITGIQTMRVPDAKDGDVKVLITSTDSRIRIYNLRDRSFEIKFKGHEHACSQLSASFSDDGQYVICGSEDRKAFIWSLSSAYSVIKDKKPCECFAAHTDIVTTAIFAPTRTRQLLGSSGDPIYDLCNPPPVTLMSMAESTASQTALSDDLQNEISSTVKKPEESPAYIARSTHYDGNIIVTTDDSGVIKVFRQDCAFAKRKHESWETGSTFSKKLAHSQGIIGRSASILTRNSASSAAHSRRGSLSQTPAHNASGPPSIAGTPQLGGSSDRILTWRQGIESNNRAGSIGGTPTRSERSISPGKVARTPLSSAANLASEARKLPYVGSSPVTSHFGTGQAKSGLTSPTGSTFSIPNQTSKFSALKKEQKGEEDKEDPSGPPLPSFTFKPAAGDEDDLRLDAAGASYSFWNLNKWKGIAGLRASISGPSSPAGGQGKGAESSPKDGSTSPDKEKPPSQGKKSTFSFPSLPRSPLSRSDAPADVPEGPFARKKFRNSLTPSISEEDPGHLALPQEHDHGAYDRPGGGSTREHSIVSVLSSEMSSVDSKNDGEGEGEMRCKRCGGTKFKARMVGGIGGRQKWVCGRCGLAVEEEKKEM
jgi:WD repeat-containing protein 44